MENAKSLWVLGHRINYVKVSGNYDLVHGETPAGVTGPPPHYHNHMDEVFIVTEGEMNFTVNGASRIVRKGETVDLPKTVVHTFANTSDKPCQWINIHSPKGFWSFFRDMGIAADEDEAVKKSVDKSVIDRVMASAIDYDMIIVR